MKINQFPKQFKRFFFSVELHSGAKIASYIVLWQKWKSLPNQSKCICWENHKSPNLIIPLKLDEYWFGYCWKHCFKSLKMHNRKVYFDGDEAILGRLMKVILMVDLILKWKFFTHQTKSAKWKTYEKQRYENLCQPIMDFVSNSAIYQSHIFSFYWNNFEVNCLMYLCVCDS